MGRARNLLITIAAITATATTIWWGLNASAEADRLRELANGLRRQLSEIQLALDDAQSERNDFRVQAGRFEEQLHAVCSRNGRLTPRVVLKPSSGPIGTRVEVSGHCLIEDIAAYDVGPAYFALVGKPPETKCELIAPTRGSMRIDKAGRANGYFVVTKKRASCLQSTRRLHVDPGEYSFRLGCHACSRAKFRITPPRFRSLEEALEFVATTVSIPVAAPPLPEKAGLYLPYPLDVDRGTVTVRLTLGPRRWLRLSFGHPSIWVDGCEPPEYRDVDVNGQRALLATRRVGPEPPGSVWSAIVWPVEPGSLVGRYGISGSFGPKRALELARAMDVNISTAPVGVEKSC